MTHSGVDLDRVIAYLHSAVLEIETSILALELQAGEPTLKKDATRVAAVKKCKKASAVGASSFCRRG
jgi:hypothetical protein